MGSRHRFTWALLLGCILAAPATAQWLDTLIWFPDSFGYVRSPAQLLVNPLSGRIYVTSTGGVQGSALVVDPATRQRVNRIAGGFDRALYCEAGQKIYLAGYNEPVIAVVDATADTLLRFIPLPVGDLPLGLDLSLASRKLYIMVEPGAENGVDVVDVTADTLLPGIALRDVPYAMVFDAPSNLLVVATPTDSVDDLLGYDCANDSLVATVPMGNGCTAVALNQLGRRLYCTGPSNPLWMTVVELPSLSPVAVSSLPRAAERLFYSQMPGRVYCTNSVDSAVAIMDCSTNVLRADVPLPGLPSSLLNISSLGRVCVAVSNEEDSTAIVILDDGDSVCGRLSEPLGEVSALALSIGQGELYAGLAQDYVSIFDAAADTLLGRIEADWCPVGGLVSLPAGRLCVLMHGNDEIRVLDSTYVVAARMPVPLANRREFPVYDDVRNRLYVVDEGWLWVVDCTGESLLSAHALPGWTAGLAALCPGWGKLYICPQTSTDEAVLVYDCVRDSFVARIPFPSGVSAVQYHPRSRMVYAEADSAPVIRIIDPARDSVIGGLSAGATDSDGRMFAHPTNGRLYFYNDRNNHLYTFDAMTGAVVESLRLRTDPDTMVWNRRYDRLYLARRTTSGPTYVFDCATGTLVDSLLFGMRYVAAMNQSNNKLYICSSSSVVAVDCRTDSTTAVLGDRGYFRYAAWDSVLNRVYMATYSSNLLAAFRDAYPGVAEQPGSSAARLALLGNPVRGGALLRCAVPIGEKGILTVSDIAGRQVSRVALAGGTTQYEWQAVDERGRRLASGIYFLRLAVAREQATVKVILE